MNLSFIPAIAIGKIVGQTGLFSLGKASGKNSENPKNNLWKTFLVSAHSKSMAGPTHSFTTINKSLV